MPAPHRPAENADSGLRAWTRRSIRALGGLLAVTIAGSGAFDAALESDATLLFGAAIPAFSSLPSFAAAALLLVPIGGAGLRRLQLLHGAYGVLLLCLMARMFGVQSGGAMAVAGISLLIAAANAAILWRHTRRRELRRECGLRHD